MKQVKAKLAENKPDEVAAFEQNAQSFAKKIVGDFKNFEFVRHAAGSFRCVSDRFIGV